MRFNQKLISGILLKRYKRFLADIQLENGDVITAHCPNSGSMLSCNIPGSEVRLSFHDNPKRKYALTWEMVKIGKTWVGINTMLSNHIVAEAIEKNEIPRLLGYEKIIKEKKVSAHSRLDLMLQNKEEQCFIEIKNVSLVEDNVALFPDAVTIRGTKHLNELIKLRKEGHRAVIFFLIQRMDCDTFSPADHIDAVYGKTLRKAYAEGVEVLPYQAKVTVTGIEILRELRLILKKAD